MVGTSNFGEDLEPGLRVRYGLEYEQHRQMHTEIFDIRNTSRAYEESVSYTGFGQVPEKTQGQGVSYADPKQNWLHRITQIAYGLGYVVTKEMDMYEQYNLINSLNSSLAKSVADTRETIAANVLNNAFDSSVATGGDGLELCSTAHLLGAGGTYANELSTAADLSETSFEQALIDISDMVMDSGIKMHVTPECLIVPNELDYTATKLLNSTQTPEDANNSINPAQGRIPYKVWTYLTDPDAWFIKTNCINGMVVYNSRMPSFTRDNDFDSENAKFKTVFNMAAGWDDPRAIFASPGA